MCTCDIHICNCVPVSLLHVLPGYLCTCDLHTCIYVPVSVLCELPGYCVPLTCIALPVYLYHYYMLPGYLCTCDLHTCTCVPVSLLDVLPGYLCTYVQVSQYTFAMCSYRERKADPTEMLQLDGFTVDYCEPFEG